MASGGEAWGIDTSTRITPGQPLNKKRQPLDAHRSVSAVLYRASKMQILGARAEKSVRNRETIHSVAPLLARGKSRRRFLLLGWKILKGRVGIQCFSHTLLQYYYVS
jgi:hypothetical protein